MHPFHSLFTEDAETEYVPDTFGRIGQGGFVVKPDPEPIGTPSPRFDAFNKAEQAGMGLTDLFGANPFAIKGPVGPNGPNRRADVGKVETFMSRSGNHDLSPTDGPTGYYGLRLEDAINAFQKANELKPDGLLKPGGKTIKALAGMLKDQIKPPTRPVPLVKPAAPLTFQGQGARPDTAPLKHPGGTIPEIAAAAPPAKDPLEAFKKADRESIKGLEASQKPKPTHRVAERTGERRLTRKIEEETRAFLQRAKIANAVSRGIQSSPIGSFAPSVKIDKVIGAYQRYLDGKGGVVNYDPKWMLKHKVISSAATRIQGHFTNWVTGKLIPKDPKELIVGRLLALKPGQRITGSPRFDGEYKFDSVKDKFSDHRLLLGNGFIKTQGKFVFTRRGSIIEVTGKIENKISDPFDFTSGRISRFGFGQQISHDDMIWLEKHGKAKPFEVRSVWQRKLVWRLRIVRNPKTGKNELIEVGQPNWADAK